MCICCHRRLRSASDVISALSLNCCTASHSPVSFNRRRRHKRFEDHELFALLHRHASVCVCVIFTTALILLLVHDSLLVSMLDRWSRGRGFISSWCRNLFQDSDPLTPPFELGYNECTDWQWEDQTMRERPGHPPPSYSEAEKNEVVEISHQWLPLRLTFRTSLHLRISRIVVYNVQWKSLIELKRCVDLRLADVWRCLMRCMLLRGCAVSGRLLFV